MSWAIVLEVDWDNDGDFGDDGEDLIAAGVVYSVECRRGRETASLAVSRSAAGQLRAVLNNSSGDYSPFNTSSPLTGLLLPGRRVRLRATSPVSAVLWTGVLDRIIPVVALKTLPAVQLEASGVFIGLTGENNRVSTEGYSGGGSGAVIDIILDAAGWPSGDRDIDAGNVEVGRVYFEDTDALEALRQIEDTEMGFLQEDLDWGIRYEERYWRDINSLTSQATFSDDSAAALTYQRIDEADYLKEIFNEISVNIQPYSLGDLAVLWTLSETFTLAASEGRTYFAKASSIDGAQVAYVDSWTTPVVGTDVMQSGVSDSDIAVSAFKTATTMGITVTNNHASDTATITMQARGVPVLKGDPFRIVRDDSTSKSTYGRRTFPWPGSWYPNSAYAEGTAEFLLDTQKDPRPLMTIEMVGKDDTHLTQMFQRAISERVTLEADNATKLGVNQDFYIESIAHSFQRGSLPRTVFELSPARDDPAYWVLEVADDLGTDTILAP